MEAGIVVELGVESGGELIALAGGNDVLIYSGDGLTVVGGNRLDVGRTDESHGYFFTNASDGTRSMVTA